MKIISLKATEIEKEFLQICQKQYLKTKSLEDMIINVCIISDCQLLMKNIHCLAVKDRLFLDKRFSVAIEPKKRN